MTKASVAFFSMAEEGHFHRLRPLISGIAGEGFTAHVFTHSRFRDHVERAGGTFVDLFAKYPLEVVDDESLPVPCRFVSFAGHYGGQILHDLERVRPSLVISDTFAVIGRVVANRLGIPYVNVCAGHNVDPAVFLRLLQVDPRVRISPRCLRAVEVLRSRHGLQDASPFSYVAGLSPYLNVYCEPSNYLTEADRRVFEPVAFYGSLPSIDEMEERRRRSEPSPFGRDRTHTRVYVSFGSVVWRYYAAEALGALQRLSDSFAGMEKLNAVISLGGASIDARALRALARPNVWVADHVDQWRVLQDADVFVTHHGLNSTHEAIFHLVPMISYPFFWDQPALAEKCRQFGLAIPLVDSPRGPVRDEDVRAALARFFESRDSLSASLADARGWELRVVENRAAVVRQIMELI
jgi:UDP:flavonoid glycosyltransferase YjiC (YdhE family)